MTPLKRPFWQFLWNLFRLFFSLFFFLLFAKVLWLYLAHTDAQALLHNKQKQDLFARRNYLQKYIVQKQLTPHDLPSFLPPRFRGEWALVAHSMTAASLTNLAFLYPKTRHAAQKSMERILKHMLDPQIRAFDTQAWREDPLRSLHKNNGHIGYLGHLNWTLAAYHLLGPSETYKPLFEQISQALIRRLEKTPSLHLETYPGETYIPDNSVVMASLALYARIHQKPLPSVVQRWLRKLHTLRDPQTKLFPFSLDSHGKIQQSPRGSGATWDAYFLCFVDPKLAKKHFMLIKKHLFAQIWGGIAGIREWPRGNQNSGDIDSGPVLFGLSPSATGFAIGSARFHKDAPILQKLLNTAELAGFSFQWGSQRRYLLAPIVGDAILLAMLTHTPWDRRFLQHQSTTRPTPPSTRPLSIPSSSRLHRRRINPR